MDLFKILKNKSRCRWQDKLMHRKILALWHIGKINTFQRLVGYHTWQVMCKLLFVFRYLFCKTR